MSNQPLSNHGHSSRSLPSTLLARVKTARATVDRLESRMLLSTTWFVSPTGLDTNPGTIAAPFRTIQHGADAAGPGDTVYIRGGVYHESVVVHNSGTSAARIVFKNYNNERVTLDGADPITNWSAAGNSVYTAPMSWNLGQGLNQVFVDGQMVNEARWPNTTLDVSHPVLATASSVTATSTVATIRDMALTQPAGFWVGATIRIGPGQGWVNQTGTVTASTPTVGSTPGSVTFSYLQHDPKYTVPKAGNHYYLTGLATALDAPGEWFRSASGQLSLRTPASDNPTGHLVEAKVRQFGFDMANAAYIRIDGLNFFACSINTGNNSAGVVINHIAARYLQHFVIDPGGYLPPTAGGIILRGTYDVLENSVIAFTAGDGVYVSGTSVQVTNNSIHDTDYAGIDAASIRVGGYGDMIDHNTMYNTGRNAMLFSGSADRIVYNIAHDYGLQTTDCGAFYTYGYNGHGTVLAYNRFYNAVLGGFGGVGIFFDGASTNFIVHHNIIWNVNSAMRLNFDAKNLQIYNNTLDATTWGMDTNDPTSDWSGTIIENNIITHPVNFGVNAQTPNNISNHKMFVDYANANFSLIPGAPAVDTGLLIPPYTNGYVGPAPDIGALELGLPVFVSGAKLSTLPSDPMGLPL
jgi:Right handed beta helix region